MKDLVNVAKLKGQEELSVLRGKISDFDNKIHGIKNEISGLTFKKNVANDVIKQAKAEIEYLNGIVKAYELNLNKCKVVQFDEKSLKLTKICPTCGKPYTEDEISKVIESERMKFEDKRAAKIKEDQEGINKNTEKLEELNLPSLRYTGNDFLRKNRIINKVYMPNLFMVGNDFLACNKTLKELSLPLLEYADESFLCYNNGIRKLELPALKEVGKFFLMGNGNLLKLNLPALKEIKDYFLAYNSKVILNMPNLRIISDKQSSHIKFMIYCNKMCNYARKTSKIRKLVKK